MTDLTEKQIKAIWDNESHRADFSKGPVWNAPIRRSWRDAYAKSSDPTKPISAEEMYVAFRIEKGGYGIPGTMGHRVTRVVGRGVVVAEHHRRDRPVFIPFEQTNRKEP